MIWKSGWCCCCCITNRSGWLLELLTELKILKPDHTQPDHTQPDHTQPDHKREAGWIFLNPILQSKLYLVPGNMFGCEKPGWFRIIFAVTPDRWVLDFPIFESYNNKNRQKYDCWTDLLKHICLPISSKPKPECLLSFPILLMRTGQSKHYKTSFRLREGMDRLERMLVWNC